MKGLKSAKSALYYSRAVTGISKKVTDDFSEFHPQTFFIVAVRLIMFYGIAGGRLYYAFEKIGKMN